MAHRWDSSDRRSELPRDWPVIRRHVLVRDGHTCRAPSCGQQATDVDHIKPGDDHSYDNLQSLCATHHRSKTLAEAAQARAAARANAYHPREQHPALGRSRRRSRR